MFAILPRSASEAATRSLTSKSCETATASNAPPMGGPTYNAIIAGCGCAGLSLALRLLQRSPRLRLCLLDKEHGAHPHKLWSFWSQSPRDVVPLPDLPLQTWEHMEVAGADFRRREQLGRLKYATVMSDEFEARALDTLRNYPGVDIISSGVRNLVDLNNRVAVHTEHEVLHAPYVFQSYRLCPQDALRRPRFPIVQHFGGWIVETKDDRFDPSTFSLMDFDLPQRDGPTFLYVLPFSERRALFEYTVFSPTPLERDVYRDELQAALSRRGLTDYDITREEYGNIPMTDRHIRQRWSPRVFNIGVVGGMSKPTTGYAFHRIQRQVEHLARTWSDEGRPRPLPRNSARFRFYDMVLLDVLIREGARGHRIFERLFQTSSFDRVLSFLDEQTRPWEELGLLTPLPWGTFLRGLPGAARTLAAPGTPLALTGASSRTLR